MARIAFILLCHKDPDAVVRQAESLAGAGDYVSIHFDGNAPRADYERIRAALDGNPRVAFARRRVRCGWGEWSLVEATLAAVEAALAAFPRATHLYMVSGDCMAIKSAAYAHEFLDARDVDYIESFDFYHSGWIKTGIQEERLIYRHYVNERKNKWLFYKLMEIQKRLGLRRAVPADLQVMIGSQWWCLRRRTVEAVLEFCRTRRDVVRFFRTTWIPDETFFQTLVRHLVPDAEIRTRTLTFLMFTDYGMPVTFYNDHYDLLLSQDYLFARKISPGATELRARLGVLYQDDGATFRISNEGRSLFRFLTERGRIGRRFAPRFWETESTLGRERELLIVACKKWHVAKRLREQIGKVTNLPTVAYLFDEESTPLPDLGGIQATLGKRTRHRRSLMRMLFDHYDTDRLLILLDPDNMELLRDFYADRSRTRLLEIDCSFTDSYLIGHARRTGLLGESTSPETVARLLPAIRDAVLGESDRIRDAGFEGYHRISEGAPAGENALPLAKFLDIPVEKAKEILAIPICSPTDPRNPDGMAYDPNNVFARILRGEIPSKTVKETEHTLAFADIAPQAPHHVLVIPKGAYETFDDFCRNASDAEILDFHRTAGAICAELGVAPTEGGAGYRIIANTGTDGRQDVPHYHLHILAGTRLGPMLPAA